MTHFVMIFFSFIKADLKKIKEWKLLQNCSFLKKHDVFVKTNVYYYWNSIKRDMMVLKKVTVWKLFVSVISKKQFVMIALLNGLAR